MIIKKLVISILNRVLTLFNHLNGFGLFKTSLFFFVRPYWDFLELIIGTGMYFHHYPLQGTLRVFSFLFEEISINFYWCTLFYVFLMLYFNQLSYRIVNSSDINTVAILENRENQLCIGK